MDWIALLGLQDQAARCRAAAAEGGVALQDRLALAGLEWAQHKRRWLLLAVLGAVLLALLMGALLLASAAVVLQFWDTPQRTLAAWLVAGLWLLAAGLLLLWLRAALRQATPLFALTRNELEQDWQLLKESRDKP